MSSDLRSSAPDHPELAIFGTAEPPERRTLVDILQATIEEHRDVLAIDADAAPAEPSAASSAVAGQSGGSTVDTVTYGELEELIEEHVQRLWDLGIGRGDRVGVRVPSGTVDLYVAVLATLFAGAAYVPVDWDDPDSRAETVWAEAGAAAVFGESLQLTVRDGVEPGGDLSTPGTADDAWIIFTSGSTGTPKGVAITHRSAAALVDAEADLYLTRRPPGPGDRVMAGLSVAFDASCEEMWLAWRYGATLIPAPRDVVRSGPELGRWIVDHAITVVSTVPTLASLWPAQALESVRLLIFGGEACPQELAARLVRPGREVWNTYGPTETTVIATGHLLTSDPPVRIGRPVRGWALAVVDGDGAPVRWGETGELVIGGVGLGRYLDAQKDREKYAPLPSLGWDRAYRTGDMVRAEPEGLIFGGRADDQIKLGGRRLELGEIDDHLTQMPGVRVGAAALHRTAGDSEVLVGYLVAEEGAELDIDAIRSQMRTRLPGGITPVLHELEKMPLKTSGKVDRGALPWPLSTGSAPTTGLDPELQWLAELWADQLGPLPLEEDSDFFALGGGSVALARLVAEIRRSRPSAEIGKLYAHPSLRAMHDYLATLPEISEHRPSPRPVPRRAGVVQTGFVALLYMLNGIRYVTGALMVVWILSVVFDAGWVPQPPLLPLIVAWLLVVSLPGRLLVAAAGARLLTWRLTPGHYLRGGREHLRLWAAERLIQHQRLEVLFGTPLAPMMHRMFGNRVGTGSVLYQAPAVTGLVDIGDHVSVEHEVDLAGHWIDGDTVHIGQVSVADGARVGTRSIASPDARIGVGAEVLPGSHIDGEVPDGQVWGGSPMCHRGAAGESWPAGHPGQSPELSVWGRLRSVLTYSVSVLLIGALPVIAVAPAVGMILPQVITMQAYEDVFAVLAVWAPLFVVLTALTWLLLVIAVVRLVAAMMPPGYFSQHGSQAWAAWLTHTLLQRTLISTYPVYSSVITPVFLRMLGASVGRGAEISTVETIPHLTRLERDSFVADHAMINMPRMRGGWLHLGTTVIGAGSFVGNSAIVGPDRDLPADSLVAVLASTPHQAPKSTSWLGNRAESIPRVKVEADQTGTYRPSRRLRAARIAVESLRILPAVITAWLDLMVVYVLTMIYLSAGSPAEGVLLATLWSGPVVLGAGVLASLVPVAMKWAMLGVFRRTEHPLFSTFVWRSELADTFAESLAVPSLVRMSIGSPLFVFWARLMGARIGRGVWCETWWLPEFDLITLHDAVTVNRGTVLQTHLFHDRVMGLETVTMDEGSTLGPNSFMLPGSCVRARSTVGPGSLVLRGEMVPSDGVWAGNPVGHSSSQGSGQSSGQGSAPGSVPGEGNSPAEPVQSPETPHSSERPSAETADPADQGHELVKEATQS